MSYKFHIAPRDLLFLRDARPMEASDAGLGANWPRPDQIWHAFISAFHRRWPQHQDWEHQHRKNASDKNPGSSDRFGGLKTAGPFPVNTQNGEIYFPCPLDLSAGDDGTLHPMRLVDGSGSNLPPPLTMAFASAEIGKSEPPAWISGKNYAAYLQGVNFVQDKVELYDAERNIGIGIDPETRSTLEHKLYQAEYLRFRAETRMAVQASCEVIGKDRRNADLFAQIAAEENIPLLLGGQQGIARAYRHDFSLPESRLAENSSLRLRWTLLAPAVFPEIKANTEKGIKHHPGGWLPNWIEHESGQVMLPVQSVERLPGEDRDVWRQRIKKAGRISARLVAARIGKPVAFSGWDLQDGPKPTLLAVPAGSVYVFECNSRDELRQLAAVLDWNGGAGNEIRNRRSTMLGEKGFGIGVCSTINTNQN